MKSFTLALSALLLAACGSPIVGAECRDGFTNCNGECVDLANDADHCGACEDSCGAFTCEDRECTTDPRPNGDGDGDGGGNGDGDGDGDGDSGSGGRDAGESPIGTGNPFEPDAGFNFPDPDAGGCPIGTIECDGECVNTDNNESHCGGCGMPCVSAQFCALGSCVDICEEPLELCFNKCVDYQTDPFNCGGCRKVCESGICELGECGDVVAGDVVVIGHDYRRAVLAMQRLAYNALNRAAGNPVRALMFEGEASRASIMGVRVALNTVAGLQRNEWEEVPVTPGNLTRELLRSSALLIPAQNDASDARLIELGQRWSVALVQFVARGGMIIVFETNSTSNAGTFQILEPSGLFSAEGRSVVPNGTRIRVDVASAIGARVTQNYEAVQSTIAFEGVTSPGAVVAWTPDDRPVVIHRVIER